MGLLGVVIALVLPQTSFISEPEKIEVLAPDPMPFYPTLDELMTPPTVPASQVKFAIRNLTPHSLELVMFICRPEDLEGSVESDSSYGRDSDVTLRPNETCIRPFVTETGWYVFFARRVDEAVWYPYQQSTSDLGKKNVCGSPYVLLEISQAIDQEVPYVWNFEESQDPFPGVNAISSDAA